MEGAVHSIKSGHASQFTRWALADCIPDCKKSPRDTWAFKNAEIEFGSAYDSWLNVLLAPDLKGSAVASVIFWASAVSSLVCSVSVSSCLRE